MFLLTLVFVMLFVPGMLDPFTGGSQGETVAVNRVADDLSQRTLGTPERPYALNETCTREFFLADDPDEDCRYPDGSLQDRVGVKPWTNLNVTVRGDLDDDAESDIVCWDDSNDRFVDRTDSRPSLSCPGEDNHLTIGSSPEVSGSQTVSARRVALLDGTDVTIEVIGW